jgi:hypothetical protein
MCNFNLPLSTFDALYPSLHVHHQFVFKSMCTADMECSVSANNSICHIGYTVSSHLSSDPSRNKQIHVALPLPYVVRPVLRVRPAHHHLSLRR